VRTGVRAPEINPAKINSLYQSFAAEWPPIRSSWYAVLGITPSREQSCRTAEPVIITVHLLAFKGCFEVATLLSGAANADAQIAIDMVTVASFVTVVILEG
jgi:hypothetical protein